MNNKEKNLQSVRYFRSDTKVKRANITKPQTRKNTISKNSNQMKQCNNDIQKHPISLAVLAKVVHSSEVV